MPIRKDTLRFYRQARRADYPVPYALHVARTLRQWKNAEYADLVRIELVPDETPYDPGDCEPTNEESRRRFWDSINQLGVYGVVGQYRLTPDGEWHSGDSVWGNAGYQNAGDWRENWYVPDIMAETLRELKSALRSRCETCRRSA